jgi:hypothetical protein
MNMDWPIVERVDMQVRRGKAIIVCMGSQDKELAAD